uniref:Biotin/lipoyl-binding protein n=1 Tax=Desulfobacca acetoxidans TaxID=60893 RepID=A0A7C3Z0Z3_9BACT
MRNRILFALAILGLLGGLVSAYVCGIRKKPLPPAFTPAQNPYAKGIYATGIVESYQSNGANINIFPEVAGRITQILVKEGDTVRQGTPLLLIDDSVQRAIVEQQKSQAEAARSLLQQLKAQPRLENLRVAKAQVDYAAATLKTARDALEKVKKSYELNPKSVSKDQLDSAEDAYQAAKANLGVAQRQYELTKAGAWIYDIQSQAHQYQALSKTYASGKALLDKYTIRAPVDGIVLAINTAAGSFTSTQGTYNTYTQGYDPLMVMGPLQEYLEVRCFIDEILVPRMPPPDRMNAQMQVRGTTLRIPLEFERIQPYVTPKIELSNQRTERVDVRVLPVLFRFRPPRDMKIYPGQLVDVYVETK